MEDKKVIYQRVMSLFVQQEKWMRYLRDLDKTLKDEELDFKGYTDSYINVLKTQHRIVEALWDICNEALRRFATDAVYGDTFKEAAADHATWEDQGPLTDHKDGDVKFIIPLVMREWRSTQDIRGYVESYTEFPNKDFDYGRYLNDKLYINLLSAYEMALVLELHLHEVEHHVEYYEAAKKVEPPYYENVDVSIQQEETNNNEYNGDTEIQNNDSAQ